MSTKICFFSLHSQPYFLQNEYIRSVSGGGKKLALIGKELAKRNFEVSYIIYGNKKKKFKKLDNVILLNPYDIEDVKKLNIFKKIFKIWNCFKKTNSSIYVYSNGASIITALYCFIKKKRYFYWMASDLTANFRNIGYKKLYFKKFLIFIDIKLAECVIVQNNFQKNFIKNRYGKKIVLIKNPIVIPYTTIDFFQKFNNKTILWVGHFSHIKQPKLFLEIARRLPQYKFIMIGGKDFNYPHIYAEIKNESEKIKNLEFLGLIPPEKIDEYYKKSTILVSTSIIEGFPNVFLEAWVYYNPVISLNFDPDSIIKIYKLVFHSNTIDQMIVDINKIMENEKLYETIGKNCRKYVEINHDIKKVADQCENIFNN